MVNAVYDVELRLLTEYLEGPKPSYTGLIKEGTKLGLVKSTLFRNAITKTGECIEFIARRLGLTGIADQIAKAAPYVDCWCDAILYTLESDNMPAFQFLLHKRSPNYRMGNMNAQMTKDLIAAFISVRDKPDSRFMLAFCETQPILGANAMGMATVMKNGPHLMRAMIYNGTPKPWKTQAMLMAHFPDTVINPEVWKVYETTCAHWTPTRHWLFPVDAKRKIKTLLTLAVTFKSEGSHSLVSVLGMLPRELMYHLINMYLGLVCA